MKTCEKCGADISHRKGRARFCVSCATEREQERKALQKKSTGYCDVCGKPLEGAQRKYCSDCKELIRHREVAQERRCIVCGEIITGRRYNSKYCTECAQVVVKAQKAESKARLMCRRRKKRFADKNNEVVYGDTTQCKTCEYWNKTDKWCDYLTMAGEPRRCEPSPDCTKWRKK